MAFPPIPFPPDNVELSNFVPVSSLNLVFTPPEFIFYWMMSYNPPNNFTPSLRFPDFSANPNFAGFTDWKLQVTMHHTYTYFFTTVDATPFCMVAGTFNYEGSLGVLTDGYYKKDLLFSFVNLNLLAEGQYHARAKYKVTAVDPSTGLRETISSNELLIEFNANAFTYLLTPPFAVAYPGKAFIIETLSYTPLTFNYHLGGSLPDAQDLYYFIRGASANTLAPVPSVVNISNPLLTAIYSAIHSYYAKMIIGLDPDISTLEIGTYNYSITLGMDGAPENNFLVPIVLNILPASTGELQVDPDVIVLETRIGENSPAGSSFFVYSDIPWQITSVIPTWLNLSAFEGSGTNLITLSPQNYNDLIPGDYSAALIISDGTAEVVLTINFKILPFIQSPFVPGNLFFTKELDFINVSSANSNTYFSMQIQIKVFKLGTFEPVIYDREFNLALLNGNGQFHLGTIVHQLFEEIKELKQVLPSTESNYLVPAYLPAEVKINYEEKEYNPGSIWGFDSPSGVIGPIKMIQGWKPYITDNNLSLLTVAQQNESRITPNSVICLGFTHFGSPQVVVKRNGIVIDNFTVTSYPTPSGSSKVIYQYLRVFNELKPGDSLEIFVVNGDEVRVSRFTVFPPGLVSSFILFENSNGVLEAYEFTGRRRKPKTYDIQKKTEYKNLYQVEKKLIANSTPGIIINTGKTLPEDSKIIDQIIKSKEVWVAFDSPFNRYVRVDAITSKLSEEDTADNENSFDVEFNILENSNAYIYSE